ncbi:hypothetical protein JQ604_25950 [Bradyrhizobium jicamae]|uniref:DUF6894 family protein n=1 Tax=Bradyrhizobium jicamae TaxID=280332 RepID=UPI001BA633F7|nr:hypothetical protein [Bradyrhizobium jicamae]MBR0755636.1 hypothetical protein [Bradyrhizobium jicamae]
MAKYSFKISNGEPFEAAEELADDDAACLQALRTVRDIESSVGLDGGDWSIAVSRDEITIFRVAVSAQRLR